MNFVCNIKRFSILICRLVFIKTLRTGYLHFFAKFLAINFHYFDYMLYKNKKQYSIENIKRTQFTYIFTLPFMTHFNDNFVATSRNCIINISCVILHERQYQIPPDSSNNRPTIIKHIDNRLETLNPSFETRLNPPIVGFSPLYM